MDAVQTPQALPSESHEVIVVLDTVHITFPGLETTPKTHELLNYNRVVEPDEICKRIQCASIVITAQSRVDAASMGAAPYLKCVITPTTGTNHIDLEHCKERGIRVIKTPGGGAEAVSEHALSMYFAARRKTVLVHKTIVDVDENGDNAWKREGSVASRMRTAAGDPPNSLSQEVAAIVGYGLIGKRVAQLCKAIGMEIIISGRKGQPAKSAESTNSDPVRTPFEEVIKSATVFFICCPQTPDTIDLIDEPELVLMRPDAIIINISRGPIVNSKALVKALRANLISGAATDVYDKEPASTVQESALLGEEARGLNLTFSPHLAHFSTSTGPNCQHIVRENIRKWASGQEISYVV
ncbi:D-isomer specific 2-hydroxyacid dehydrogenase [Xylariales sp. PMI_506]|nr:D-isomer specific 2-hydroxyacid dehydrogenase [Xylariales sp. PMI_506]